MIGAIIGDIVGSQFEMMNYTSKGIPFENFNFHYFTEKCKPTDDTVLSIAIGEFIIYKTDLPSTLKEYAKKYPNAGYGSSFIQWVDSEGYEPYNSYGNGSAMRVSPVGWLCNTREEVLKMAEVTANPTHNHEEGIKGAKAIALAIFLARKGEPKEQIKFEIETAFGYNLNRTLDEIRPTYEFNATCQGTVPEAIIAFLESNDFEDCLKKAISIGGDSDTIACMACSIAEAYYGLENIPDELTQGALNILSNNYPELYHKAMKIINSIYANLQTAV